MNSLFDLNKEELIKNLDLDKPYRADVIISSIIKGKTSFSDISSLPKELRERLSSTYLNTLSSNVVDIKKGENAVKLLIKLGDGLLVECVRLKDGNDRYTACLSSQVGCKMKCAFCKTGTMGFIRSLTKGEIIEEFIHLLSLGETITHIVFMGMGEPLDNFQAVLNSILFFHTQKELNISYRKITISTSGVVPAIKRLSEIKIPIKLAVSLLSANDLTRTLLMPINKAYPLKELKKALKLFQKTLDKRITLEYCLLKNVNMSRKDAEELYEFTKGLSCLVNLIPWNTVQSLPFKSPNEKDIKDFTKELTKLNIPWTLRLSKGREEEAACGQLATSSNLNN